MTPEEVTAAREELALGPVAMARAMGVSYEVLYQWESGRRKMPAVAARCLELLLRYPRRARELASKPVKRPRGGSR